MVRLKDSLCLQYLREQYYFNSKMVRLKAKRLDRYRIVRGFQFQDGTIKSELDQKYHCSFCLFQFQDGTIKSQPTNRDHQENQDFNSKMVRLKELTSRY